LNDKIQSISSELLSCGAIAAQRLGTFPRYHRAIFDAVWRDNLDVASTGGFINVITEAGVDGRAIWQLATDPDIKAELAASSQDAAGRGVFGTPTFVFKDELFFGNDRLDFLRERIAGQVP
jgi:2-hydroxychromene-2-carboxylate isomerase